MEFSWFDDSFCPTLLNFLIVRSARRKIIRKKRDLRNDVRVSDEGYIMAIWRSERYEAWEHWDFSFNLSYLLHYKEGKLITHTWEMIQSAVFSKGTWAALFL